MKENKRKNLIISADDFGISPEANQKILKLIRAGKIDRVSIMVNENISPNEILELKNSEVLLDIHLELIEIKTKKRKLKDGIIKRSANFLFKYLFGKISAPAIELSWEKQIQKFKEIFAKFPDGINSHQHIHFLPAYFKIILKMSQKFQIPYLRFGKYGLIKGKNNVFHILNFLHKKNSRVSDAFDSSDFLVSLDWIYPVKYSPWRVVRNYGQFNRVKNIENFLENLPRGETEIICHPEREEEFEIIMKYF